MFLPKQPKTQCAQFTFCYVYTVAVLVVINIHVSPAGSAEEVVDEKLHIADIIMSLVAKAFESSKIVPDVIPTAPTGNIELKYPSGAQASQGNELTPTQVKDQPTVSYEADSSSFYTLVFTDPDNYDGPEPVYREWHHWLVGNIPGSNVTAGETLSAYIGSGPPEGTGIHRYVYILYKQPGKIQFDEPRLTNKSIDGRAAFSTKMFAEKYNLGAPVAGNFYRAQFDDYVPQLYKGLGVDV